MTASAPALRRRLELAPLIGVTAGLLILCGLGTWQVQRLAWKTRLLERIAALQTAPPEPLAVVLNRIADHVDVDFTHVVFACPNLERTPIAKIYAVTDQGVGYRIITACPIAAGPYQSVLVDRGFLADEAMAQFKPAGAAVDEPIVGVLRSPSAKSVFTPGRKADHAFFSREIAPIAAAVGARDPAPVFFMLESPKPQGFGPTPAPVPTDIPNNHLGYALTWFGLAAGLLGVYIASLLKRRKT